jgi:alkyldihydroxyacetonephosphate synthase
MSSSLTEVIPRSVWHGWGDPARAHPLSGPAWRFLRAELGLRGVGPGEASPPVPLEDVALAPSRLGHAGAGAAARQALADVVGPDHVHLERNWRIEHAGGKGYPDLYRLRTGDGSNAPDGVVVPGGAGEVAAVLTVCAEHRVAVVPFGGGTSVVGGVGAGTDSERFTAVISLDLRRLDDVAVDSISTTATLGSGLRGPEAERALHAHGLTLGHYPQSHQQATVGGYVATRSAGQASTGYGRIDDNVVGLRLATPRGELVLGGRAPASAAGPRLLDVVVGSEGTLGVITEATLRVAPLPTGKRHAAWVFPSFVAGAKALRGLTHEFGRTALPTICRLSDEDETRVNLTLAGGSGRRLLRYVKARGLDRPALLVLVWEGTSEGELRHRQRAAHRLLRKDGGRLLPKQVARAWERGRFEGPYLRDELMAHRFLVETLETATTWANLSHLHAAVRGAIRGALEVDGRRAVIMCHVSHVYPDGASLYYTFVTPQSPDPLAQWRQVKTAASQAILEAGGTITHHHAIGTDHRAYLPAEIGEVGVGLLRAIKAQLDPSGILNPGKLIP